MSRDRADVLVLGAGIVGCAVAEELVRRGRRVQVLDPRGVAGGATHASAGMLTPHSEGRHAPALEALGARSLELYDEFVARLADGRASSLPYARTGSLDLALDDTEAGELAERARADRARGVQSELLTPAEVRELERDAAPDCRAALFTPAHGYVSAPALAAALWRSARAGGATALEALATHVEAAGTGVRVRTPGDDLVADHVVLAAGSWAGSIAIGGAAAVLPVRPIRGQLLQLQLEPPAISRIIWGTRCYTVSWPDGTLLVGATLEDVGFDDRATVAGVHDLLDAVSELIPRAWQAQFVRVRVGLRPATPDARPIIGPSRRVPGLVYATGHYRNGVLLAPLTARLVADLIDGRSDDPALRLADPARLGEF